VFPYEIGDPELPAQPLAGPRCGSNDLETLVYEPSFDPFGDARPFRIKHHVVARTRNELSLGAVVLTAEHGQPA
jgi:hypothetical protein